MPRPRGRPPFEGADDSRLLHRPPQQFLGQCTQNAAIEHPPARIRARGGGARRSFGPANTLMRPSTGPCPPCRSSPRGSCLSPSSPRRQSRCRQWPFPAVGSPVSTRCVRSGAGRTKMRLGSRARSIAYAPRSIESRMIRRTSSARPGTSSGWFDGPRSSSNSGVESGTLGRCRPSSLDSCFEAACRPPRWSGCSL